jgi:Ca2+-binding RTX toxin-like protein
VAVPNAAVTTFLDMAQVKSVSASDVDGDTLAMAVAAAGAPTHGTVTVSGLDWTYTPDAGYTGADAFTLVVSDGQGGAATHDVTVTVQPLPAILTGESNADYSSYTHPLSISGTAGNDIIVATPQADALQGGAGNDSLDGGSGGDTIEGEAGNDTMTGGLGADTFVLEHPVAGNDVITDFSVADGDTLTSIYAAPGAYRMSSATVMVGRDSSYTGSITFGGDNPAIANFSITWATGSLASMTDDTGGLTGAAGANLLVFAGTTSGKTATGGATDDVIQDLSANGNTLIGGGGADLLEAGSGADAADGGSGNDTIDGGGGNDTIIGGIGADTLTGGIGGDVFSYTSPSQSLDALASRDTITDFVTGTDQLKISLSGAQVDASSFASVVNYNAGQATLAGGGVVGDGFYASTDQAFYIYVTGTTTDIVTDGGYVIGSTAPVAAADLQFDITGTSGNDSLVGGAGADTIAGGDGNDIVTGGGGTDTVSYAAESAGVLVNLGAGVTTHGGYTDTLSGIESVTGSAYADTLMSAATAAGTLTGGAGDDTYVLTALPGADLTVNDATGTDTATLDITGHTVNYVVRDMSWNGSTVELTTIGGHTIALTGVESLKDANWSSPDALVAAGSQTSGDDIVLGKAGDTILEGGGGADMLVWVPGVTAVDGGAGSDNMVSFAKSTVAVVANMTTGTAVVDGTTVTLTGVSGIEGGSGDDILTGGASQSVFMGRGGNNTINGSGSDTVGYGDALAGVSVNLTTGTATHDSATDTISGVMGVMGSDFNDTIEGTTGAGWLEGGAGNDTFIQNGGNFTVSYYHSPGAVTANLTTGSATDGVGDTDSWTANSFAALEGSAFNDALTGTAGNDWFSPGKGADAVTGGGGSEYVNYYDYHATAVRGIEITLGTGTITVGDPWSLSDTDTLTGTFTGVTGTHLDDTITCSTGTNYITGSGGADSFQLSPTGTAVITDFSGDTFILGNSDFSLGTTGTLAAGSYAEDTNSLHAMSGTTQSFGTGAGIVAIDNGSGGANIWYSTDLANATTANSQQVAQVTVDTTAIDNTSFHLAV